MPCVNKYLNPHIVGDVVELHQTLESSRDDGAAWTHERLPSQKALEGKKKGRAVYLLPARPCIRKKSHGYTTFSHWTRGPGEPRGQPRSWAARNRRPFSELRSCDATFRRPFLSSKRTLTSLISKDTWVPQRGTFTRINYYSTAARRCFISSRLVFKRLPHHLTRNVGVVLQSEVLLRQSDAAQREEEH